jgi:hypothetical protein
VRPWYGARVIMSKDRVLVHSEIVRRNLSIEESEHFIKSFVYKDRKDMYTDEHFNTVKDTYID